MSRHDDLAPGRFAFGTELPSFGFFVYAYFREDGRALYVGQSYDLYTRHAAHRQRSPWYPQAAHFLVIGRHEDRASALAAEKAAIVAMRPAHNRTSRRWAHKAAS